ncbi:sugar phosphate isomerase/epimerase [Bartonella sp. M0283]|uniref:sugar phosphate isomerase/epimerase family protein n=1 Tax=Bartonella sp. M0283 TaxID=2751016 RepID=UPI0018DE175C|nr:sugar phosphate isomerase/epimerase family protein [Bartonella sp. M0283]MBI0162187.1 sugar phosphate isomerase/epimerase [Bartonella sp. M0283]
MRLSISNIAWDSEEDAAVARLLQKYAVDAIDIAPAKYFKNPRETKDTDILRVKNWWADQGIEITGMQSLLFGTQGLNVFGDNAIKDEMLDHLQAICNIANGLQATRLVFGSPKNRDRNGLDDDEVKKQATEFFYRLGEIAEKNSVVICLEPNPPRYGANFMTNSADTAAIVRLVNHNAIGMQFDTGALQINGEDPEAVLKQYSDIIKHIHASEPDLVPLGDGGVDHRRVHDALIRYLPDHVVTIEMVATKNAPHLASIEHALSNAIRSYRPHSGVGQ